MRALPLILLMSCACASGCDTRLSTYRITSPVPAEPDGFSNALYQSTAVKLMAGHQIELVNDSAIFDRLEEELGRAQHSINVVLFIWRPSLPSQRLVKVVAARAKAGVACRIIIDPLASTDFEKVIKPELVAAGCDVRAFRPLTKGATDQRNHRKIVVVDGKVGFTGGFGIADAWAGDGPWRESSVRVEGPAVNQMQQAFAANWQELDGPLLPPKDFPDEETTGETRAGFVSSTGSAHLTQAERLTQLMIASATKRVWIANAYFVPSPGMISLLVEKKRQGVDVRIMAAGEETDQPQVLREQRATYPKLLEAGVRLWEYAPTMLHSKTMLVDDHLSVIGSINLDRLSLNEMEEGSLVMSDPRVVAELVKHWESDLTRSREVPAKK